MVALHHAGAPRLIAPDTLGHGDSAAAAPDEPDIGYYADSLVRLLDAMGIDRAAIYGAHTGARTAVEAGVLFPDRFIHVILDGIGEYDDATQADLLANYAPEITPDDYGTQMIWAFNYVRDQALHFPWYDRDPAHRLMSRAVPDAEALHVAALEVLKSLRTYHKAYAAAFRYPTRARLAALTRPVALLDMGTELPALRAQTRDLLAAARDATHVPAGTTVASKAAAIVGLLA